MGSIKFLQVLSLLFLSIFSFLAVALEPDAANDTEALLAFKRAVTGDPSGVLHGWDPTAGSHCEWQGVVCDGSSGRVTGLELSDMKAAPLAGVLAADIGNLTELRFLSLRDNSFSGEIPAVAFSRLGRLELLDLSGNNFSGRIPEEISNLLSLGVIDLSYNSLNGWVPESLFGLPLLKSLDLSSNQLSGEIRVGILGACRSLNDLKLSDNFLVGKIPSEIAKCSNLRTLLLDGNILEGQIPAELGRIAELHILDVSRNSLIDRIPVDLGNCRKLSVLILTNLAGSPLESTLPPMALSSSEEFNAFIGAIPHEVISIPSLEILWAPRANLDGRLPNSRKTLCSLRILNLGQNYISSGIPEWLGFCGNLTFLDLSSNYLQGSVPLTLGVQCMAYFNISRNSLSGSLAGLLEKSCSKKYSFGDFLQQEEELPPIYFRNLLQSSQKANPFGPIMDTNSLILHDFSLNNFSGSLPYLNLTAEMNLSYGLLLNNNGFNGLLSGDLFRSCEVLGNFAVNLSSNQISGGIEMLSNCLPVKSFEAADNNLNGSVPDDIANLLSLLHVDLRRNHLNGTITDQLGRLKHVERVLLGDNHLSGTIPAQLGTMASLKILDLSLNSLTGVIPSSLADATNLEMLLLDHNKLSGEIPPSFSNLSKLAILNVSFNNLSGEIPQLVNVINCESFRDNHFLESCPQSSAKPPPGLPSDYEVLISHKNKFKSFMVAAVASTATIVVVLGVLLFFLIIRRNRLLKPGNQRSKVFVTFTNTPAELTYDNVLKATGNFGIQNLIGTGGFGATYKAELLPGYLVAVKRLSIGRFQGLQQFDAEIRTLGRIRHKNLVTLMGYHMGEVDTFLIYNYLSGGNLETFIKNMPERDVNWPMIYRIAFDVAQGLSYLHYSCVPRIVHRDIKPSNILLDEKLNAYISDFGLARLLEVSQTHATTDVAGTFGYVAPEYATTCRVSDKADVYSFGVVLLELMSGKRSLDPSFSDYGNGFNIVTWGRLLFHEERLSELVCPFLWKAGPKDKMTGVLRLALSCTVESLSIRPSMKQAVETLKQLS